MHSEVVSEMLKEWQEERRRRLRPLRSRDLDDDESRLSRIWVIIEAKYLVPMQYKEEGQLSSVSILSL